MMSTAAVRELSASRPAGRAHPSEHVRPRLLADAPLLTGGGGALPQKRGLWRGVGQRLRLMVISLGAAGGRVPVSLYQI